VFIETVRRRRKRFSEWLVGRVTFFYMNEEEEGNCCNISHD
jgi:hypothetical protein